MKEPNPNLTSQAVDKDQEDFSLSYPMFMPSAKDRPTAPNSNISPVTDNGEFEPIQTDAEMSLIRNTGEPNPGFELPSDTVS